MMDLPRLYLATNNIARYGIQLTLEDFFHYLKWKNDGSEVVLDVGCGPGNCTAEVLLPKLPENIKKLIGCDISEDMVKFANTHYQAAQVEYSLLDIATEVLPETYKMKFTHVLSFYCLHWIQNQRKAYENIYNVLRPGGETLLSYLDFAVSYVAYEALSSYPRWSKYMKEYKNYMPPFFGCSDTPEIVADMLKQVGFDVKLCKMVDHNYVFDDVRVFRGFLKSINPFMKYIETEKHEDYLDDMSELFKCTRKGDQDFMHYPTRVLIIHATKPHV